MEIIQKLQNLLFVPRHIILWQVVWIEYFVSAPDPICLLALTFEANFLKVDINESFFFSDWQL